MINKVVSIDKKMSQEKKTDKAFPYLPEEFKNIKPIESAQEMFEIVESIVGILQSGDKSQITSLQKYQLSAARMYFNKNVDNFSKEDYLKALKNKHLLKNLPHEHKRNLFNQALAEKKSSPVIFQEWFTSYRWENHKHRQYIEILNAENNYQQLHFYNLYGKSFLHDFYFNTSLKHSPALIEVICENKPANYLINNSQDDNKMIAWLKDNAQLVKEFFYNDMVQYDKSPLTKVMRSFDMRGAICRNFFYDIFIDDLSQKEGYGFQKNNVLMFLSHYDNFLKYLHEQRFDYFKNISSQRVHNLGAQDSKDNFIQKRILGNATIENYRLYKDISLDFFEQLNEPFQEMHSLYNLKTPVLESILRNNSSILYCVPYIENIHKLNDMEKEMLTCFVFNKIINKKPPLNDFETLIAQDVLSNVDYEILEKVYQKHPLKEESFVKLIQKLSFEDKLQDKKELKTKKI